MSSVVENAAEFGRSGVHASHMRNIRTNALSAITEALVRSGYTSLVTGDFPIWRAMEVTGSGSRSADPRGHLGRIAEM
jgi:hypothetical protein